MARRLALLGPAVVVIGAVVAGLGSWWMLRARPHAGAFVDVIALDAGTAVAVREEASSDRGFVELRRGGDVALGGELVWQAMVPRYAGGPGRPGIAVSQKALSVRVVRDGRPELFGLSMRNAAKLGGLLLARQRPQSRTGGTLPAAVTLFDGATTFELVGHEGDDAWATLAAVDLDSGREKWHRELGEEPVRAAGLVGDAVWLRQGDRVLVLSASDGKPIEGEAAAAARAAASVAEGPRVLVDEPGLRVTYDRMQQLLEITRSGQAPVRRLWPTDAREPWPYHVAGGRLWVVFPDRLRSVSMDEASASSGMLAL